MKQHRLARIAEVVREVAAETILFEIQDPRVKNVTVTRAEVSADLQHAKVFVSVMGTPKEQDLCLHGLQHSAGFVQSKLASRLKTRFIPTLKFVQDEGVKKSIEVTRLINEALAQSRKDPPADAPEDEATEAGRPPEPDRESTPGGAAEDATSSGQ